jgi:hypothetical protein
MHATPILPMVASLLFASCALHGDRRDVCSACDGYWESKQTREQGNDDAKRDVREKGFRILRYDLPAFRTGDWFLHVSRFEHFGIEEADEMFASLDYCRAYNAEMDRQLLERYGSEYRRLRSKILPPPGAKRFEYVRMSAP